MYDNGVLSVKKQWFLSDPTHHLLHLGGITGDVIFSWVSRLWKLLAVLSWQTECWTVYRGLCCCRAHTWILIKVKLDKSDTSSSERSYEHGSEGPCPVLRLRNVIYDWQLICRSQNTPAWPAMCDSIGEKHLSPNSSPSRQSGPVTQHLSAPLTPTKKNTTLISNSLFLCSQYSPRMLLLMAFQSYAVERRQDYEMSFPFFKD